MSSAQKCIQPCRCHYVQRWLDVHEKYFPGAARTQHQSSSHAYSAPHLPCTFSKNQNHDDYNNKRGNIVTSKLVTIPYVLHAPHGVPPVNPLRK